MIHSFLGTWAAWTALTRSHCATVAIFLTFAGISANAGSIETNAQVTASGFVLNLGGKPFAIKGMNYSPVPTGAEPKYIPYGDFFIPYYANVWKPDIDKIRAAGVNVIKLFAGNPNLNAGAPATARNCYNILYYCFNKCTKHVTFTMFASTNTAQSQSSGP